MEEAESVVPTKEDDHVAEPKLDVAILAGKNNICEVCGHANAPGASICEMCSNYLFLQGGKD